LEARSESGNALRGFDERTMKEKLSSQWVPALAALSVAGKVFAQPSGSLEGVFDSPMPEGPGWAGFLDIAFMGQTLLTLTLAAVLGAIIAFHPKHSAAADTLEELEAPKVYILYAVIGAIIGILVMRYGIVVGFVVFGIGGLIRFRTLLRSANLTGRVIFVTLIGLTCGFDLPHVAVLATVFAVVLIYVIETRITYRIDVQGLDPECIAKSAAAYRELLVGEGCRVVAERKSPMKQRFTLLVSAPHRMGRDQIQERIETVIDKPLQGTVDWETD
jgi:hypothetical protein